jgi:NAD(P)-dependent dehydrogenase (short-subunit alcohol dehydrogenase family)
VMSNLNYKLAGKVAFVSGGSHGIGLEIAKILGLHGCILFSDRRSSQCGKKDT